MSLSDGLPRLSLQELSSPPPLPPGAAMRWDTISRLLPEKIGDVLEIGCGRGAFAARLSQSCDSLLAIEPDATSFAIAREMVVDAAEVRQATVESLPEGARFDLVCAFEVLEHLEDDCAALLSWVSRVKPGGMILLSTPAHSGRLGAWDKMVGHYRRYDVEQMRELLQDAGLTDVDVRLYGHPFGSVLEEMRNVIARRRMRKKPQSFGDNLERTSQSSRLFQPDSTLTSLFMRAIGLPLCKIQRFFPNRGIALVAVGRMPA